MGAREPQRQPGATMESKDLNGVPIIRKPRYYKGFFDHNGAQGQQQVVTMEPGGHNGSQGP